MFGQELLKRATFKNNPRPEGRAPLINGELFEVEEEPAISMHKMQAAPPSGRVLRGSVLFQDAVD